MCTMWSVLIGQPGVLFTVTVKTKGRIRSACVGVGAVGRLSRDGHGPGRPAFQSRLETSNAVPSSSCGRLRQLVATSPWQHAVRIGAMDCMAAWSCRELLMSRNLLLREQRGRYGSHGVQCGGMTTSARPDSLWHRAMHHLAPIAHERTSQWLQCSS